MSTNYPPPSPPQHPAFAYPPPPGQTPPPPRRSAWLPVGIACGSGCALLVVLAIVSALFAVRGASGLIKNADPVARQFIQYVGAGQDDQAYAMTSSAMRAVTSKQDFTRFANMWRAGQGKLKSATQNTRITLGYAVEGSAGSGQVTILLVEEGSQLRVLSANFNPRSPAAR